MVVYTCRSGLESGVAVANLRSVSAFWVDVVDGTPRLWTAVFTASWVRCQSHVDLDVRLSRSDPIAVEHSGLGADDIAESAFRHLLGSGERWRTVVLRASWTYFTTITYSHHLPQLTSAILYLEGDAARGALRWLGRADVLNTLTLICDTSRMSGSFTLDVPAWPRLSSLTLCGLRDGTIRFLASLIKQCSSVEHLRVDALVDPVDEDVTVENVSVISMPALRTLRLDNHTSFVLAVVYAPRLQQLTLNDMDDYRFAIVDLQAMLNRPGAPPRLEELRIARVDSGLPSTSDALLQCLSRLQWLKVLDIDDFSMYTQSFGCPFLFDSLTFRWGSPVIMPALSVFYYRPSPSDAFRRFVASRRWPRAAGSVVAHAVTVSERLWHQCGSRTESTTLRFRKLSVTLVALQSHVFEEGAKERGPVQFPSIASDPAIGNVDLGVNDNFYTTDPSLEIGSTMAASNPIQEVTEGTAILHMQGSLDDNSKLVDGSPVDHPASADGTGQGTNVERSGEDIDASTAIDDTDASSHVQHTGNSIAATVFDDAAARSFMNSVHVDKESERYKAFRGDTVYGWAHVSDWAYAHGCYDNWYKITEDYSITHVGKFEPEAYREYPKIDTTLESMAPAVDDMKRVCVALGFAEGYDIVNPSRVDPHQFIFGRHPDNYQDTKDTLMSQRDTTRPVFCVTTGILRREFLSLDGELPYTNAKKARRGVAIAPFESEINRAFAFFNLAAKMPSDESFGFPCAEHGTILITTKPSSTAARSSSGPNVIRKQSGTTNKRFGVPEFTDAIPVLDGRDSSPWSTSLTFANIKAMKTYDCDLVENQLVTAVYTVSSWVAGQKEPNLSFNLNAVIVLSDPIYVLRARAVSALPVAPKMEMPATPTKPARSGKVSLKGSGQDDISKRAASDDAEGESPSKKTKYVA
ncbi:uncharacterized protein SCHCODRAFT_02672907 [Schizophyllum commune H4-8]|uniref:uncharacterized protein n=1 Tax=Schizophyllum commune (strain H4-8 / FGSC 9210) TaxID=578458 RepID=UPI00215F6C7C|nr:uncharacterized protein SCHCODRAFT_02718173 [Schizophyllum commune H4-8]XP_050197373.1 uncharacterized protein SCHCODRAFT_02672907 [Schizophyllum commune H4-8]KAI5885487.1 hypothetical protein SCHCODRAFT_02718173 [Schizophyllum commune H4-8]KAI5885827.1 hypothetical protein SCHCODRAFT_02672907 [Schizophyllum commune H4-8]